MKTCSVRWCLDLSVRRGSCALHLEYPLLNSKEERDAYFARLRAMGVGGVERRRRRTPDAEDVPLIDANTPAETGIATPKDRAR